MIYQNPIISAAGIRFESTAQLPIKKLGSFKKQYRLPDPKSHSSLSFVGGLVRELQHQRFKELHATIRHEFKLKRKDIDVTIDEVGSGVLECPILRYESSYFQSEESPELLTHSQRLDEVTDLNLLTKPEFKEAFGFKFSFVGFPLETELDIETLIDRIEDLPEHGKSIRIDYNFDASCCEIELEESASKLFLKPLGLELHSDREISTQDLLLQFSEFQAKLVKVFEI